METQFVFSEVSKAYNGNIANLEQARRRFEGQLAELNDNVMAHLKERCNRPHDGIAKIRFAKPEDWGAAKDGPWLKFSAATRVGIDIKPPSFEVYKKGAVFLYFESVFDNKKGRFVFQCRLENSNDVETNIDETAQDIIKSKDPSRFPDYCLIKTNTAIISKWELSDELYDKISQIIDDAVLVCEETVDKVFPDSAYSGEKPKEDS